MLLRREPARGGQRLDLPGAALVGGAMFCLVYGLANAATHGWHTPSTWGFLVAGVVGLAAFAGWQARAKDPLLPPRVVLDRNRGGAYLAMLFAFAGMFGIFLFVTYYLQTTLGYSPIVTGFAYLPMVATLMVTGIVGQIVLMPRTGPKPLVGLGMLIAAGGMVWLTGIGVHSGYVSVILGPLIMIALGLGLVIAPAVNTGTYGVAPYDAGVASATINVGQQLGGSIGTALINTLVASATASYLSVPPEPGDRRRRSSQSGAGPAVARARLCRRLLVDGGHLRRRRRGVRDAAAARAAVPAAGARRGCAHGRGTGGGTGANRRPPGGMTGQALVSVAGDLQAGLAEAAAAGGHVDGGDLPAADRTPVSRALPRRTRRHRR